MKFEQTDFISSCIIYCKDGSYNKKYGNIDWYDTSGKQYFRGCLVHREDGPAIDHTDGYKAWCLNGKSHREDGPVIENIDGYKEWWLNGRRYSEEKYYKIVNLKKKSRVLNGI